MVSRIIVKNLPKKITEEKFRSHFDHIGQITDAKLKFTKDGKFRQFGFIGFKSDQEAQKAIEYFNNTFVDASKIQVEECKTLNDSNRPKAWSKYTAKEVKPKAKDTKVENEKKQKVSAKEKKLDMLLGPLKDDADFKEFLAANKAIKSSRDSIWKNDFNMDAIETESDQKTKNNKSDKNEEDGKQASNSESSSKKPVETNPDDDEADFENGRLFVRNLCYTCKEEDLEKLFEPYGPLVECSMPIDSFSKAPKGFAYITCMFPEKAIKAFNDLDGSIYQGRMLHIIPAKNKKEESNESGAGDNRNKDTSYKAKKETELKKSAQAGHNWNTLFINQDAVANLMSAKYNVDKSDIFDVHSTQKKKPSTAVRLAVGETQIVNDIRKFLVRNGVKLEAFTSGGTERSKTCILVKNLPTATSEEELRELFKKCNVNGEIKRLVMPEYGVAALVEFAERQEARDSFKKLAYRKFKSVPIYLEWAPVDVFDGDGKVSDDENDNKPERVKETRQDGDDQNQQEEDHDDYEENATLFVKNLNFNTTDEDLKQAFSKIGKCKATIARKISPNKEMLSMGYGFIQFKKAADANEAIKTMQNFNLDGHNLELKFSTKTKQQVTASNKQKQSKQSDLREKSSKIMVRNIPFEAKTREVQELFQVFGELKYVRLPKKIDGTHRGFGFVDFVTINDAQKAYDALSASTHLYGRRLVLEWAEPEQNQDVEILRAREEQISGPSNKRLKRSRIVEDLENTLEENNKMETS